MQLRWAIFHIFPRNLNGTILRKHLNLRTKTILKILRRLHPVCLVILFYEARLRMISLLIFLNAEKFNVPLEGLHTETGPGYL